MFLIFQVLFHSYKCEDTGEQFEDELFAQLNYNQVVKVLNSNFTEKKALAFLYRLEKQTMELVALNRQIIELTKEFEQEWLQK